MKHFEQNIQCFRIFPTAIPIQLNGCVNFGDKHSKMRVVLQRVSEASVTVNQEKIAAIGKGYLVLLGVEENDDKSDTEWLVNKILNLRIFSDEGGKMNLNLGDVDGELLVVSQFTLHAKTKKGNRPSFIHAAQPEKAKALYEEFIELAKNLSGKTVQSGEFGADMKVALINDGPVTICIDTKNKE